ncbi:Hypothetical protein D9617_22g067210 [Elsinoe fawcettii]|nr:Hypothetical protein D9617_22g067210 [Elsinoe fawcettii]
MKLFSPFIGALATIFSTVNANSDIISLSTRGSAYIAEAAATLILPPLPNPIAGDVSMWSGIHMERQASFVQGVTSNSPQGSFCGWDASNSWCNLAYVVSGQAPNWNVNTGDAVAASPRTTIRTHYKLNPSTQAWDQKVYVNGRLSSTLSSSQNQRGDSFYISIECASGVGTCSQHPAHTWEDISIVLSQPDLSFEQTGPWNFGGQGGVMSTPDGGRTWNLTALSVPSQEAQ